MDVLLSERQLKKLFEQDATADPAAQAPTAGTSSKQAGGQGYPEVGKWESGVTRGPANQVGITKWADVVGSKLNRGKANQLKEQTGNEKMGYPIRPLSDPRKKIIPVPQIDTYVKPTNPEDSEIDYVDTPVLTYKTFWNEDIKVPGAGMSTVRLWKNTDIRQMSWQGAIKNEDGTVTWTRNFKDPKTGEITTEDDDTPDEDTLREIFKDGTVSQITSNVDGRVYKIHLKRLPKNEGGYEPKQGYYTDKGEAYDPEYYLYISWRNKVEKWIDDNWVLILEITGSIIAGIMTGGAALWIRALAQVGISLSAVGLGLLIKGKEDNIGLGISILIACLPFTTWGLKIGVKGPLKMLTKYGAELATARSKFGILRVIAKIQDPIEKRLIIRLFKEAPAELINEVKTLVAKGFVEEVKNGTIKLSMITLKQQGWWKQTLFEVGGGVGLAIFGEPLITKLLKKMKVTPSTTMDNSQLVDLNQKIQGRLKKYSDEELAGFMDPVIEQYSKLSTGSEEDQYKFCKIINFILDEYEKNRSSDLKKLVKDNYNTIIK
jgi:hypothetical protein